MRATAAALALLVGTAGPAVSQPEPPVTPGPAVGVGEPESPGWTLWAGAAIGFGHLLLLDTSVRETALGIQGPVGGELASVGHWVGDWQASLPWLAGGASAVALVSEGPEGLREVAAILGGVFAGSMANEALNQAVGRSRPREDEGPLSFRPLDGHASFPSGHTAFTFAIAGSVDAATDGWVPAAAGYGLATVTGLSRIYHDAHWLTDVVAGAALGTVVSRLATGGLLRWMGERHGSGDQGDRTGGDLRADRPTDGSHATERLSWTPFLGPRSAGVRLRF